MHFNKQLPGMHYCARSMHSWPASKWNSTYICTYVHVLPSHSCVVHGRLVNAVLHALLPCSCCLQCFSLSCTPIPHPPTHTRPMFRNCRRPCTSSRTPWVSMDGQYTALTDPSEHASTCPARLGERERESMLQAV